MKKKKHGKPRRGSEISEVASVRIDPAARKTIEDQFQTMGNALYFLADGIRNIGKYRTTTSGTPSASLKQSDLEVIRQLLHQALDVHDKQVRARRTEIARREANDQPNNDHLRLENPDKVRKLDVRRYLKLLRLIENTLLEIKPGDPIRSA